MDEHLQRDTLAVGDLPLSRVLLMNDSRWHWLVLVPRRANLEELTDLDPADRERLIQETALATTWLKAQAKAEKINVGAPGNVVRQLRVHVIAWKPGDPGWPGPVWGFGAPVPYIDETAQALSATARKRLLVLPRN